MNQFSHRRPQLRRCVLALSVAAALPAGAIAQERVDVAQSATAQTEREQSTRRTYAQELVDALAARHPELLQVDIHAAPAGSSELAIIAARSRERIGRKSDADDVEVFRTGTPRVEINRKGDQNVEVALPLIDVSRRTLGTLELTFPYLAGTDEEALAKKAEQYRDELSRRILSDTRLTEPLRFDARIPSRSNAQYLVDDALARHPEVEVIALHARPPYGGTDYAIVASNIGRIGKVGDPSDLEVVRTGRPVAAADSRGARFEVKVPLQDARGETIGVLATVFPLRPGADQASLVGQAQKIRDELRPRITSENMLYGAYPVVAAVADPVQTEYDKPELGNTQTLPMTKAVTSGAALEQASQEGYSEAVKGVAGVVSTNSKGSPNDAIAIRGIKLNLFSNYRLNGGLPTAGVITTPNENKERIETLKGANALMFGVASPAGIINLVTKRAGPVDVTSFALAGNSWGQFGGSFDVGRRFGPEKEVGLRVNASAVHLENGIHDTGGYGRFGSVGFDMRITDRLSLQADLEYYMKHVVEQGGISLLPAVNGRIPITPVPNPRNLLSGRWSLYPPHTTNQQIRADYVLSDSWKVLVETGRSDADRSRYTVRIGNYDIVTGAGGVVNVQYAGQDYKNAFSRVEALGKFSTWLVTHDLTLGYSETERDAISRFQFSRTLTQRQNVYNPIELPAPVFTTPSNTLPLQASFDKGVYGYDTISIGKKWKLLLGMRRTKDEETNGARKNTSTVSSPAYGVLFDPIPSLTLFASYLEGLEAGGTAPATAINSNEILPSAVSTQKEIGIRDSHIRGLSLSSSYFQITRANAVTDPVTRIFANSGEIEYKGLEATVSYEFLRRWTVNAAGMWLKAEQVSPDPTFNGFVPENTPKAIGNFSISYKPPIVAGLTVNAGVSAVAKRFVNNQEQGTIPGYSLFNAGVGYVTRFAGKRVAFQLNGDNLANKRYWNSVQTGTYGIGMDRSFKFNVRVDL